MQKRSRQCRDQIHLAHNCNRMHDRSFVFIEQFKTERRFLKREPFSSACVGYDMTLKRSNQMTTGAKLLQFKPRAADVVKSTHDINRRLRNIIILANALAWVVIAVVLHAVFF